jgi:hypothetical protein
MLGEIVERSRRSARLSLFSLTLGGSILILISSGQPPVMAFFARDKEKERFYLLPGMGGRNLRRKRLVILRWSIVAGLFTSLILGLLLYYISRG